MKNFSLVKEAYCTDDYADSPAFAHVEVTEALVARIQSIAEFVAAQELASAKAYYNLTWDQEDDLRIRGECLVVTKSEFWFTAYSKYGNGHFETRSMLITDLLTAAEVAETGTAPQNVSFVLRDGVVYYDGGNNEVDHLVENFTGVNSDEEAEEA